MTLTKLLAALAIGGTLAASTAISGQATAPGNNGRILFQGNVGKGSQLFTIKPDGSGLTQITHAPEAHPISEGAWSADGTRIGYSQDFHTHGSGYIARADGTRARRITPRDFQFAGNPAWTPGGHRLVVSALSADPSTPKKCDQGLRLVTTAGKLLRNITHHTGAPCRHEHFDVNAAVSPDGKRVAFRAQNGRGGAICVIRLNGRGFKRLTPFADDDGNPVWSPDGSRVLFQSDEDDDRPGVTANLFTIRPDGTGLTQITHLSGAGYYAGKGAWSPDGTQIVYHKVGPNNVDDLFLLSADGSNERQLTHLGPKIHPGGVDWGTNQG